MSNSGRDGDESKVRIEVDGVVYSGRRSVQMSGSRVWIDGQEVGVEVDKNGEPIDDTEAALPVVELLPDSEGNHKSPWRQWLFKWMVKP